jgi:cytosolic carboxypeptidase protein 2/3
MKKNCEGFSYDNCQFGIIKAKESTGRVVAHKEFSITNSYTLECSFCGPTQGSNANYHFNIQDLLDMGSSFVKSILEFSNPKMQK